MAAYTFTGVEVDGDVEAKINGKHNLSVDDVFDALETPIRADWDHDPNRGTRLLVEAPCRGQRILIVLRPVPGQPDDEWSLVSAYPIS